MKRFFLIAGLFLVALACKEEEKEKINLGDYNDSLETGREFQTPDIPAKDIVADTAKVDTTDVDTTASSKK